MKTTIYKKLVRDDIPAMIESLGKQPTTRILNDDEYCQELDRKLQEEVNEYLTDKTVEELADILEVVYACAQVHGSTLEQLEYVRREKYEKRGGFAQKIYLESVSEDKY